MLTISYTGINYFVPAGASMFLNTDAQQILCPIDFVKEFFANRSWHIAKGGNCL